MRIIKFRICHEAGGYKSIIYPEDQNKRFFISLDGMVYENYGTSRVPLWENVFYATVFLQQFTGYQDQIGGDVYEGDILEEDYDDKRTVVRWSKAYSGFQWCEHELDEDEPTDFYGGISQLEYKTIVGNIFENEA